MNGKVQQSPERTIVNLNEQVKSLRKINAELERKVEVLEAHIYHQRRFRNVVKNLVFTSDQIITLHLTKFTKKPHFYPVMHIDSKVRHSPESLLAIVQEADAKSFQGQPSFRSNLIGGVANSTLASYLAIRKASFKTAKLGFKLVRRSLGRKKHDAA